MPRCDNRRLRILHAIHDFLPRHGAGSEIYAFELARELAARHDVSVLTTEFEPSRPHGHVTWRVYEGLPVIEIVNNWVCSSFEETYRPPVVGDRIAHVLSAVQPDVLHVHNLLNLSFDLPAMARARGIRVVATLHDYALVCPSGGQRIHRAEAYLCDVIDTARCVRCFRESPTYAHIAVGRAAAVAGAPAWLGRAARGLRRFPWMARSVARTARRLPLLALTRGDIDRRLQAARSVFENVDLFVAPSPSLAAEYRTLGLDASKIHVADYGFNPLTRARPSPSQGPLRIGYVGTLVWHKGVHVLVEAVRALPPAAYELKIFGDPGVFPDYVAELHAKADGLPIRFMGAFSRERTAEAYAQMDVLVVPSLWLENSPLVIHEAFMAGVPVVGARIGGIADLIEHGRTGLLYAPRSTSDLTALLRGLIDDRDRVSALSQAAPPVKSIADDAIEWERRYADLTSASTVRPRQT